MITTILIVGALGLLAWIGRTAVTAPDQPPVPVTYRHRDRTARARTRFARCNPYAVKRQAGGDWVKRPAPAVLRAMWTRDAEIIPMFGRPPAVRRAAA